MGDEIFSFMFRLCIIVCFWAFIWGYMKPKGQLTRIVRAGLLVLVLLFVLAVMRMTGTS
jgi:uncharacterized membrane protein YjjP (DUF1212 family)